MTAQKTEQKYGNRKFKGREKNTYMSCCFPLSIFSQKKRAVTFRYLSFFSIIIYIFSHRKINRYQNKIMSPIYNVSGCT